MKRAELRKFRPVLEAKRSELARYIQARRSGLTVEAGGDRMDEVRSMDERNATAADVFRMSRLLESVEQACRRMDAGTFGTCQACGDTLPRKRLELVPWAPYCVACQDLAERARLDIGEHPLPFPESLAS